MLLKMKIPQRAIWVPAGVPHEMSMAGPVTMLNTYIRSGYILADGYAVSQDVPAAAGGPVALTLHTAAYIAEILRGAIQAIPPGICGRRWAM